MKRSFKDSLKILEADIQHANALAFTYRRGGACFQMRMSCSAVANLFQFMVQWSDCRFAGTLGLLKILIYKVYVNGTTTLFTQEKKASINEFYDVILPSLMQLQKGITEMEYKKQRELCIYRYSKKYDIGRNQFSEIDAEREEECGICLETSSKVVLPNCCHAMCMKCYCDWDRRSKSCPFCRDTTESVKPGELWIYTCGKDITDMTTVMKENLKRFFLFIDKLPQIESDYNSSIHEIHFKKCLK